MKVISKYFKVALCFMAFALCSFMFAFTPTYTAVQAAEMAIESYNVAINALKMPTEEVNYENGDEFNVPLLSKALGSATEPTGYTIRVIDPAGAKHDYVVGTTSANSFFGTEFTADADDAEEHGLIEGKKYLPIKAHNDGEYKVVYIVSEGSGEAKRTYYSNTYRVVVANVSYELDFSTPVVEEKTGKFEVVGYTKNIIKTTMAPSNSKYELPNAYAKIAGKDLEIDEDTGKVTNKIAKINVTFSPQDGTYEGEVSSTDDSTGITSITPSEEGIYTVEYYFEGSANRPTKTYKIIVEEGFEAGDLKLATTPTMPKMELGKTITLPKLTVNAGDEKNVDVNITSIKIEKEGSNGAIAHELKNNNLEFVMSPSNFGATDYKDMVGNYRITYTVESVYDEVEPLVEIFKVDGVTVSSKPTIKLSYNYDLETDAAGNKSVDSENVVFGVENELEAEYSKDVEFTLPAVYVEDAVTTNFDDFKIIRTIRKGSTYYYLDNLRYNDSTGEFETVEATEKGYNAAVENNIGLGDPTKAVKFKFNTGVATNVEGTYYLEYKVISKQVKERENTLYIDGTTEKYSFKVVASTSDYTDPTIKITNLRDSAVKNTNKLTVKVTSTDTRDTRLKNVVFTHSGSTGTTLADKETFEDYLEVVADNLISTVGSNKYCHILDDERLIKGWTVYGEDDTTDTDDTVYAGLSTYFKDVKKVTENETKNSFDLDLTKAEGKVYVVAATLNDGQLISTDSKELTIKDTTDQASPEISIYASKLDAAWKNSDEIKEFKVGQGEKVTLPSVYVVDHSSYDQYGKGIGAGDKTLSLNVMYYIDSPENSYGAVQYLSPANKSFTYETIDIQSTPTEVQVINGGTITTSATGVYYVAYTATDVAGNTSVMYFTFEVEDTSKPILSVEPVADDITIAGNTVTGPKGTIVDFETTLKSADGKLDYSKDGDFTITIDDGGKGLDYQPSGNSKSSYLFNDYGTYIVTITGEYTRIDDDKGNDDPSDDETTTLTADSKIIKVIIEKQQVKWLGEFDVTEYAKAGTTIKLPDVAASNDAVVEVTYIAPGDTSDEAKKAEKVVENGYSYWTFETEEDDKGTFKVKYTATTEDDVLTKEINIKVGDYQPPTLKYDAGELTQNYVYDGKHDIDFVLEVNKKDKSFVAKVINNGKEVISHDIGLVISDTDDTLTGGNVNMSWTNLEYEVTGDHVAKGETSTSGNTTTTHYTISGAGSYSLKFTMTDSYDNVNDRESIDFKVVTKASVKKDNDSVVGAVLIIVSLVLLAGVILFFTFTGKKGGKKVKKAKTTKVNKTEKAQVSNKKVETVKEEVKEVEQKVEEQPKVEEVVQETEEVQVAETPETETTQETEVIEEKVDEEPKSGDVE